MKKESEMRDILCEEKEAIKNIKKKKKIVSDEKRKKDQCWSNKTINHSLPYRIVVKKII